MGRYQTEQKKMLLSYMRENEQKQFSAEELSAVFEKSGEEDGKKPGKSTIYRLVSELAEEGVLRRFPKSEGRGWTYQYHAQGGCSGHLHLKCEKCGALQHLDCGMSDELLAHIEKEHGFKIDNGKTVLFGLCASCRSLKPAKPTCSCHRHER